MNRRAFLMAGAAVALAPNVPMPKPTFAAWDVASGPDRTAIFITPGWHVFTVPEGIATLRVATWGGGLPLIDEEIRRAS